MPVSRQVKPLNVQQQPILVHKFPQISQNSLSRLKRHNRRGRPPEVVDEPLHKLNIQSLVKHPLALWQQHHLLQVQLQRISQITVWSRSQDPRNYHREGHLLAHPFEMFFELYDFETDLQSTRPTQRCLYLRSRCTKGVIQLYRGWNFMVSNGMITSLEQNFCVYEFD